MSKDATIQVGISLRPLTVCKDSSRPPSLSMAKFTTTKVEDALITMWGYMVVVGVPVFHLGRLAFGLSLLFYGMAFRTFAFHVIVFRIAGMKQVRAGGQVAGSRQVYNFTEGCGRLFFFCVQEPTAPCGCRQKGKRGGLWYMYVLTRAFAERATYAHHIHAGSAYVTADAALPPPPLLVLRLPCLPRCRLSCVSSLGSVNEPTLSTKSSRPNQHNAPDHERLQLRNCWCCVLF